MAYYEKSSSKDLKRLIASLMLLFIAGGAFTYLVSRFGPNPMALRKSVTLHQILNPDAEVKIDKVKTIAAGQVAGEKDQVKKPAFSIENINVSAARTGKNTVEVARINNIPFLRYNDTIVAPQGNFDISNINFDDAAYYPWKPLLTASGNPTGQNTVFSYYVSPDSVNAVFVMRWGDDFTVYVYNEADPQNQLRKVTMFKLDQSKPSVPRALSISPEGRYIALGLYKCEDCQEAPVTMMIDTKQGYYQSIGKTSVITWGSGGNFQYKEYQETDCPDKTVATKCTIDPQYLPYKEGSLQP